MISYGVAADGRTLLPECDGPARTCQTAERRAMSRMSRSRLGHASPRLAFQDRFGPRWLGARARHSPLRDYRPGLDRAALRSFGLASDILGNAATLGPRQESRIWFARFGVVTLSHHPAPAPSCARTDAGRASASRGLPRWPRRQAHPRYGSRSGCRVFPLRPSASARPAAPIPHGAFRSTPLDVSPAPRLRSTRRARACAP